MIRCALLGRSIRPRPRASVACALVFACGLGCSSKGQNAAAAKPQTTPHGEDAVLNMNKPDEARVRLDLSATRAAIRTYQQLNQKFPASLDELELKLNFPADLEYDAGSGSVHSRTYSAY